MTLSHFVFPQMFDLWPDLSGTGLQEENIPEGNSTSFRLCLGASSTALCWYRTGMRSIMKFILTLMLSVKVLKNLPSNVHVVIHASNKFICCTLYRKVHESKTVQLSRLSSSRYFLFCFILTSLQFCSDHSCYNQNRTFEINFRSHNLNNLKHITFFQAARQRGDTNEHLAQIYVCRLSIYARPHQMASQLD